ncbi:hypothetical protein C3Y92_08430 [Solidesulfovibrio carbinolicus]|uniref:Uncharacterized protein n=1 Tax=Solidesulfovibrio carbinolicus TaxID=296842 RepID=A0A4P6HL34_9BACT|nr:hypothetical protein C3Y92_08430 [Solidesulfovibrio carbinolicus]
MEFRALTLEINLRGGESHGELASMGGVCRVSSALAESGSTDYKIVLQPLGKSFGLAPRV